VFRIKPFWISSAEFSGPVEQARHALCEAPDQGHGHAMVARAGRPVQGRYAPAMPVACGNP